MDVSVFAELTPPYSTIVADPPWQYGEGWPPGEWSADKSRRRRPRLGWDSWGKGYELGASA